MKRDELKCIPPDGSEQCDKAPVWYVWFAGTIGYTYACDAHLQEYKDEYRDTVTQVTRIEDA